MTRSFDLARVRAQLAPLGTSRELPAGASRRAAVAAVLREVEPGAGAELLFIRRAEHPLDPWSGHMAFPGGRMDPTDRDLVETAVRETREEVGLDLEARGSLLARLPDVTAVARSKRVDLVIAPYVFVAHDRAADLSPNDEVAETLWVPLTTLANNAGRDTIRHEFEGAFYDLPAIHHQGRVIWGLTHQMLLTLFEALQRP